MRKNFVRKKEDFICQNCGKKIIGSGYTNHCPNCLYSKHVDLNIPGDRENKCGGLMKPINIEKKSDKYIILHKCLKCGTKKKNKASRFDSFETLIKISEENQK